MKRLSYIQDARCLKVKATETLKVKSTVICGCHNKVQRLKHHVALESKPVIVLKVYLNDNQCSINANLM